MQEHFLNGEIYYRTNAPLPGRQTLVFVHGVSGSSSAWIPYEKIFEGKYNILTYDIRGHGMSKKFPNYSDYEIKNFVNDLHTLVSSLNIPKFILISNSFAGLIHLEYIKLYPETVAANVFTSPEVYLSERPLVKIFFRPVLTLVKILLRFLPFNPKPRGHVDYSRHINSSDWDIRRNLADMRNTGLHAHFYSLSQSFVFMQEYLLEKIAVPTLIIHGKKDTMVPLKNALKMSAKIKNSEFMLIHNVDHNTVHNAVKEVSGAIESFISSTGLLPTKNRFDTITA